MSSHLTDERYFEALIRFRDQIQQGLKLEGWDSDIPGDKDTQCSWGLCSKDPMMWPDAEDHMWPDQFEKHGRSAPNYRTEDQFCPLSQNKTTTGCFYDCRFFQGKTRLTRDEALAKYNTRIKELAK